jgi:biopolymer transport protein ExbD
MSFLSEEELKGKEGINLAPMIDFLFLMLVFFASLAISRVTTRDTDIDLVEIQAESKASLSQSQSEYHVIHLSITGDNQYKWVTEIRDYTMSTAEEIKQELTRQFERGLIPKNPEQTQILLKIDKDAKWEPILKAIFAIREAGFEVYPVYQPENTGFLTENNTSNKNNKKKV